MKRFFLFLLLLYSSNLQAQDVSLDQSPSSTQWQSISNDFVKVIYPDFLKHKAIYIANLIEHYSRDVGATFSVMRPEKITLVLRADVADPNGFVTLGPRRTEWFSSAAFAPLVGTLDWYQSLAIHEYRHVMQFDFFNQSTVTALDYLFGDMGIMLAAGLSMPAWYFEGDAVWAETKYTDGGRGRFPRFLARLKGVLLTGEVPTYDQFINGTYKTKLPNHYILGYILVSRARQKFGDDFWTKVEIDTASIPLPFRFLYSFAQISGQDFEEFYDETFAELKTAWAIDKSSKLQEKEYSNEVFPHKDHDKLYYVRTDLDSLPAIYCKDRGREAKVREINYISDFTTIDMAGGKAVYNELHPDVRYGHRGYSNVVLVDLESGDASTVVSQRRIYAPRLSRSGDKILAVEFAADHIWRVVEFNLKGDMLRSVSLAGYDLVEATHIDKDRVAAISLDGAGRRALVEVDLNTSKSRVLIPDSRNMIMGLESDDHGHVLFEADYQGYTEIFKLNVADGHVAKCTKSIIGAYTAWSDGKNIYYSDEGSFGKTIKMVPESQCKGFKKEDLLDFKYLSNGVSDHYNKFEPVAFPSQTSLHQKNAEKYQSQEENGFDRRAFTPHSWNFFVGRGFGISAQTNNYQNDFSSEIQLGSSAEENTPYSALAVHYSRFYPILSLLASGQERQAKIIEKEPLEWKEYAAGAGVTLPYTATYNLFTHQSFIQYDLQRLQTSKFAPNDVNARGSIYAQNTINFGSAIAKAKTYRSLAAPWAAAFQGTYNHARSLFEKELSSYRKMGLLSFNTPGFFKHDGFELNLSREMNKAGAVAYKFMPKAKSPGGYVFSRGYNYFPVDQYTKGSLNYYFPLAYPDYTIGGLIHVKQLYANLYYDQTHAKAAGDEDILRSAGAELTAESVIFRLLPISFRARTIHRYADSKDKVEFFVASGLSEFGGASGR